MKNHKPKSNLRSILGMKPKQYTIEINGKEVECMDIVRTTGVSKGEAVALIKPIKTLDLWAYYDPLQFPAARWMGISTFIQLATAEPTKWEMLEALTAAYDLLDKGDSQNAKQLLGKAKGAAQLAEYEARWLNLATGFLLSTDEDHYKYEEKYNTPKKEMLLMQPPGVRQAVCNWAIQYFTDIMQGLQKRFPRQFTDDPEKKPFLEFVKTAQKNEDNIKIMLMQMANEDATKVKQITNIPLADYFELSGDWALMVEKKNEAIEKQKK